VITSTTEYLLFFDGGSRGNPGAGGSGSVVVRVRGDPEVHYRTHNKMADKAANQAMDSGTSYQAHAQDGRPELRSSENGLPTTSTNGYSPSPMTVSSGRGKEVKTSGKQGSAVND
jgi:hypothetical protein